MEINNSDLLAGVKLKEVVDEQEQGQEEERKEETTEQTQEPEKVVGQEIDYTPILTKFGDFKSLDDVVTDYTTSKTKITEYENKLKERDAALAKITEEAGRNNFANETLRKINELVRVTGRDDLKTVSDVVTSDLESLSDVDVLLLKAKWENPKTDISAKKELLESRYNTEFPAEYYDDETTDAEKKKMEKDVRIAKALLKEDADKVREELLKVRNDIKFPEQETEEQRKAKYDSLVENYKPVVDEVLKTPVKIPIKVDDNDTFDFEVKLSEEMRASLTNAIVNAQVKTPEELNKVVNAFVQIAGWTNKSKMLADYKAKILAEYKDAEKREIYNVTEKKSDVKAENKETPASKQREAAINEINSMNRWTPRR